MKPGRGTRAAMNAAMAFIVGLLFVGAAFWAADNDAPTTVVWAAAGLGLMCAIPLAWYQLFE